MSKSSAAEAFERTIKDAEGLLARFDEENSNSPTNDSEILKRAGMIMAVAAWETYVKERIVDEIDVWLRSIEGSPVGKFVRRRLNEELKRFFNPNTEKTKRLFFEFFEIDITLGWKWGNYDPPTAKKALDALVSKRGDAAHKANSSPNPDGAPHVIKRDELQKAIRFLRGLVTATDQVTLAK